jgi:hypothetical protein
MRGMVRVRVRMRMRVRVRVVRRRRRRRWGMMMIPRARWAREGKR